MLKQKCNVTLHLKHAESELIKYWILFFCNIFLDIKNKHYSFICNIQRKLPYITNIHNGFETHLGFTFLHLQI